MPRGGYRKGSGGKPTWKHGRTKTIRVPIALAEKILEISRLLDEGEFCASETESKEIDLKGVAVYSSGKGPYVLLSDLARVGYAIRPERLTRNLRPLKGGDSELENLLRGAEEKYSD